MTCVYTCTLLLTEWQETVPEDSEYTTDSKSHTQPVQNFIHKFSDPHIYFGACGGLVVKALRYKPAGRGFDSRWCHWNFSVT